MISNRDAKTNIRVKLWGVRGSLPTPGPQTKRFGGNTSCIEIGCGNQLFIFDAGSGMRELGIALMQSPPVRARIFLTHYHCDHIFGFPFFLPAYVAGNELDIYGERKQSLSPRRILQGYMSFPYSCYSLAAMQAKLKFHTIQPGQRLKFGEAMVCTHRLNHPFDALGYRIEYRGSSIAYISDYEHFSYRDEPLIEFVHGVDAMIYDSPFSEAEYATKQGWGHSTWEEGVKLAAAADVKLLIISHHEPTHDDKHMVAVERRARQLYKQVWVAREKSERWF
ncbi:MAG: MBL fold metallo-hydrolase [Acidobacteriota bacterium]